MRDIIPLENLQEGFTLCLDNCKRLLYDAKLLLLHKRYASSIILSVYSIEEAGKALLLKEFLDQNKVITRKIWFEKYRTHEIKIFEMHMEQFRYMRANFPIYKDNMKTIIEAVEWRAREYPMAEARQVHMGSCRRFEHSQRVVML